MNLKLQHLFVYTYIFTYTLNKSMRVYQILSRFWCRCHGRTYNTSLLMRVPPKDLHCMSLDVDVTEGLTQHVSWCGCHGRSHTAWLLMWVPRKDSQHAWCGCLSRCGCHGRICTACILMWVSWKYRYCLCIDVGVTEEFALHVSWCMWHVRIHSSFFSMWVRRMDWHGVCCCGLLQESGEKWWESGRLW